MADLEEGGELAHPVADCHRLARTPERVAVVHVHADGDPPLGSGVHYVHDGAAAGVAQGGGDSGYVNEVAAVQVRKDLGGGQSACGASGASVPAQHFPTTKMIQKLDAGELALELWSVDGYPASQLFEYHVAVGILSEAAYPYGFNVGHKSAEVEGDVGLRARDVAGEVAVRVVGADVVGVVLNKGFAECQESDHCLVFRLQMSDIII